MEEIKFRSWYKQYKKYMEILLLHHSEKGIFAYTLSDGKVDIPAFKDDVILEQYIGKKEWFFESIRPNRPMREIYEGDIVRFIRGDWESKPIGDKRSLKEWLDEQAFIGEVVFHESEFCLKIYNDKFDEYDYLSLYIREHGFIEIIGNIHDNPELINENKA